MRRREFLGALISAAGARGAPPAGIPVYRVIDARARCDAETLRRFWNDVWPEAMIEFGRGGVPLRVEDGAGEMRLTAGGQPMFIGLRRGALNLVLTDHLPVNWDSARALPGVTTIYDGYAVSVIAMRFAHGNQVPFLSVNTVVHELLHAILGDIFVRRPKWYQSGGRESRIDWYATRLWLFHDGSAIRDAAPALVSRLGAATRTP